MIKKEINQIYVDGEPYALKANIDYDSVFSEMIKRFSIKPTIEHKCNNCGALLIIDNNKHIFKCDFCGSCYAIGTQMIADGGLRGLA